MIKIFLEGLIVLSMQGLEYWALFANSAGEVCERKDRGTVACYGIAEHVPKLVIREPGKEPKKYELTGKHVELVGGVQGTVTPHVTGGNLKKKPKPKNRADYRWLLHMSEISQLPFGRVLKKELVSNSYGGGDLLQARLRLHRLAGTVKTSSFVREDGPGSEHVYKLDKKQRAIANQVEVNVEGGGLQLVIKPLSGKGEEESFYLEHGTELVFSNNPKSSQSQRPHYLALYRLFDPEPTRDGASPMRLKRADSKGDGSGICGPLGDG